MATRPFLPTIMVLVAVALSPAVAAESEPAGFQQALRNGEAAREGFERCRRYVEGWLALADPETGLIPRNAEDLYWNAKDSAADNYPFMVLTTSFTDRSLFDGRMRQMLATEIKLTSRIGHMPDTYDFALKKFLASEPDLDSIMFGSSEYIKDGLLPLTEWVGPSPWCDRMIAILDDMWAHAPVHTPYGKIISTNQEVNGEMLQTLSRIYWMTGDKKYLNWAVRLGDYYLLGNHHPTRDTSHLRLRDHGCEIVSGLCELYAAVHFATPEKKALYEAPIHEMLDRILEVGRNEHGLFYDAIDPVAGIPTKERIADTWGYSYNGFYTVYLIDKTESYRVATVKALSTLNENYRNYPWEGTSSDGYADAIEGALNLYNREPVDSAAAWIDSEIRVMWGKQQDNGVIEGWHGDGNFARTTLMYCLWKTQGVSIQPWRPDVVLGAVRDGNGLLLALTAQKDWKGTVVFDVSRHKTIMNLPLDWPRINQFPEWFTVDFEAGYTWQDVSEPGSTQYTGEELHAGVALTVNAGEQKQFIVLKNPLEL